MANPHLSTPRVIVAQGPARRRWPWLLLLVLVWSGSLYATWQLAQARAGPECERIRAQFSAAATGLQRAAETEQSLRGRIAVLERAEQVARGTSRELQSVLLEREVELAALQADLSFYQRLVGGGGEREGLSVHRVALQPSSVDRVFGFTLTLSQNLKQGRITNGQIQIAVEGVRGDSLETLDWARLAGAAADSPPAYSFRYFQQIQGSIILPEDFQPHRLSVRLVPEGRAAAVDHDISWADALSSGERIDVRQ